MERQRTSPSDSPWWFPGRENFQAINDDADERQSAEQDERIKRDYAREAYLIDVAEMHARQEWKATDRAPTVKEVLKRMRPETGGWPHRWNDLDNLPP